MNQDFDYIPQNMQSSFEQYSPQPTPPPKQGNAKGYAIASLCLGLGAIFCTCILCCFYYLAIFLSIISIVMAFLSRRDNGGRFSGMAVAGLILGICGLLFFLFCLAVDITIITMPVDELREIFAE